MLKKLLSVILCVLLFIPVCTRGIKTNAEVINKGEIIIDTVTGNNGDSVIVNLNIKNNPGIAAVSISITYDSSAVAYEKFFRGDVFKDYVVANHSSKNMVRMVCCESKDRTNDGIMLSIKFKIRDKTNADFYKIDIDYSSGDFCNWNLDRIMPTVTSGGIDVNFNPDVNTCNHNKFNEWTTAAEPSCDESGAEQRSCTKCGHTEFRDTTPIGHEYQDIWTVDIPATAEKDGTMSRHCKRCDSSVDSITYSLKNSEDGKLDNSYGADNKKNDFLVDLYEQQNPNQPLSDNKPGYKPDHSTDNPSQNSSDTQSSSQESKDEDTNNIDTSNNSDSQNQIENSLGELSPEAQSPSGETVSVIDKIKEVIPDLEGIVKIFIYAVFALLTLILI